MEIVTEGPIFFAQEDEDRFFEWVCLLIDIAPLADLRRPSNEGFALWEADMAQACSSPWVLRFRRGGT
jgi:hypothetical protein